MGANQAQAELALSAYLERGRFALEQLEDGQIDDVEALLKWREAAFFEFRAADHIEAAEGSKEGQNQALYELWQEIEEVNKKLENALTKALDKLGRLLVKRIENRKKLAKFHSGMDRNLE